MPKRQTPTAVRVARWTAIAAGVTALGSTVNTMWEKKPWFLGGDEPAQVERVEARPTGAHPMIAYEASATMNVSEEQRNAIVKSLEQSGLNHDDAIKKAQEIIELQSQPAMSIGPEPTLYERAYYFSEEHPIYFWLIVSCIVLLGGSTIVEYFHRRNEKKASLESNDFDSDKGMIP